MCFEEITNYVGGRLRLGDGPVGNVQAVLPAGRLVLRALPAAALPGGSAAAG